MSIFITSQTIERRAKVRRLKLRLEKMEKRIYPFGDFSHEYISELISQVKSEISWEEYELKELFSKQEFWEESRKERKIFRKENPNSLADEFVCQMEHNKLYFAVTSVHHDINVMSWEYNDSARFSRYFFIFHETKTGRIESDNLTKSEIIEAVENKVKDWSLELYQYRIEKIEDKILYPKDLFAPSTVKEFYFCLHIIAL